MTHIPTNVSYFDTIQDKENFLTIDPIELLALNIDQLFPVEKYSPGNTIGSYFHPIAHPISIAIFSCDIKVTENNSVIFYNFDEDQKFNKHHTLHTRDFVFEIIRYEGCWEGIVNVYYLGKLMNTDINKELDAPEEQVRKERNKRQVEFLIKIFSKQYPTIFKRWANA